MLFQASGDNHSDDHSSASDRGGDAEHLDLDAAYALLHLREAEEREAARREEEEAILGRDPDD